MLGFDELELLIGKPLARVVSSRSAILSALERSEGSSQALRELKRNTGPFWSRRTTAGKKCSPSIMWPRIKSPAVKLLDSILLSAMQRRASDIHIEASDKERRRSNCGWTAFVPAMEPLDVRLHAPLVSRLKVMSELDIAERRVPQDGSFRMRLDRKTVDFRVSGSPQRIR